MIVAIIGIIAIVFSECCTATKPYYIFETLPINEKLKSEQSQQTIESMIQQQLEKLTKDQLSIKQITSQIDIDLEQVLQTNGNQYIASQLNNYYTKHQNQTIASLLPNQLVTF